MYSTASKPNLLLYDWQESVPLLTFGSEQLHVVERFVYLSGFGCTRGEVSDEINLPVVNVRAAYPIFGAFVMFVRLFKIQFTTLQWGKFRSMF